MVLAPGDLSSLSLDVSRSDLSNGAGRRVPGDLRPDQKFLEIEKMPGIEVGGGDCHMPHQSLPYQREWLMECQIAAVYQRQLVIDAMQAWPALEQRA